MTRPTAVIARHATAYATGSVVGGISRAVLLPVIARTLAAEEFGILALLLAATNFLHLVFELGLVTALIRYHHETDDEPERGRLRSAVFLAMPLLDLAIGVPLLLARDLVSRVLFGTPEYGVLVAITIGVAFFAAQFQLFLGHLRSQDRSREFAVLMAIKGAVSLSVTLALVFVWDFGVTGFLIGNLAGPALVAFVMAPRFLVRSGVDLRGARERLRTLLRFGLPLVPSALGLWALSHLDAYLLRVLTDLGTVGLYGFGSELCLPIALLFLAIHLAWPSFAFARAREEGGPEELARVFRHLFVVLVGAALAIGLLRREILEVIGTETYAGAARVIPFLGLATVLYAASQIFATGLQVAGDTRRLPLWVLVAAVTNVVLNLALIPRFREVGAAAATVVTNILLSFVILRESDRQFPIPFEVGRLARVVVAATALLFAGDAFGELALAPGIGLRLAVLALFPLVLVPIGAISAGELRALPGIVAEIAGRKAS